MKKNRSVSAYNVLTSILLQITTIVSGFIIPRIILKTFGSEINGLVSSLNQLLNYVTILEGGVSSVILANLYKPIINKDENKISSIILTAQSFFRKISLIFIIYTLIVAIVYPFITSSSFSYSYIFSLTIILATNLFIQYTFSLTWKLLLEADKKVYIVSLIQILVVMSNTILSVILVKIYPSIHILKLVSGLVFCLQPILYKRIIKKYFKINKKLKKDNNLLKERWNGFGINIAAFIHFNTDITILTLFTNLKIVSVYATYSLVTTGLRQLVMAASSGIVPSIGHAYNIGNKDELNELFDHYEFFITNLTFFLFTIGGLLISPFVMIYTNGINDVNYYQPLLGYLLIIAEGIYCFRDPYVSLAYSANKFKEIKKYAYVEAIINIVISLVLVYKFKLIGVAIGTIIAITYRAIFHLVYLKKNILNRPIIKAIKIFLIYFIVSIIFIVAFNKIFLIEIGNIVDWIEKGTIAGICLIIIYIIISKILFKKEYYYYKNIITKIKK